MESLRQDVRQTLRMIYTHKTFSAAVCLTLTLGIGATTAMFSIVYGVLLRPLPFADSDRIMRVFEEHVGGRALLTSARLSDYTIDAWTPGSTTLEAMGTYGDDGVFTIGRENPVRMRAGFVSPSLFRVLRVRPAVGRFFDDQDATEGAAPFVVVGFELWRDRYGSSPTAVGQDLIVDGVPHTIIGVAPAGFDLPDTDWAFWKPLAASTTPASAQTRRPVRLLFALARLRPDVSGEQAAAEGTAAARSVARPAYVDTLLGKGGPVQVRARPILEDITGSVRPAVLILMTCVGLVLFVACANVANLLLARGHARHREMAVRAAMGAPMRRLAQQLMTESLLFALIGGLLGVALAWVLVGLVPVAAPADFPRLDSIRFDWRMFAFASMASLVAGMLAGALPAINGVRFGLQATLRQRDVRTVGRSSHLLRANLIVVEAALAVLLVICAGLLVRSFTRLLQVDAGYEREHVLVAEVSLPEWNVPDAKPTAFFDTLLPRLQRMPGVRAAASSNMMPFGTEASMAAFDLPSIGADGQARRARTMRWVVTPDYAAALGLRLKAGRFLEAHDVNAVVRAMVVNEEFVRQYFDDGRLAVGRQWRRAKTDPTLTEVVGVVGNVLKNGLDRQPQPEIYEAASYAATSPPPVAALAVRTTGDPEALASDLRQLVRETDPRVVLDGVGSLTTKLSASVARPRFAAWLLALFAVVALMVAATGLYGVLSYAVVERRRELSVRAALGATRVQLVHLVLRHGLGLAMAGIVLGLIAAASSSRLLASLLFGVTPYDPIAFGIAPLALSAVAFVACLVPAWRAAATDPVEGLRAE